jgi:hypothetical protein
MKPLKCYIRCTALYGAETWTFWKVDKKYLKSSEIWCCRRMEISSTNHVRQEEVLQRVKEGRNIPSTIKIRKTNGLVTSSVRTAF